MRELDHDNESRFDCEKCQESGIDIETRDYCNACELGKRRMNLDRLAEPLRSHPFTDAMWVAHHSAIKSERAIAAADKALLVDRAQRAEAAKLNAEGRALEMSQKLEQAERELAGVQKDAIPNGYALVPVEPTHKMVSAMACSKAIDDEGEFPILADLLDFSGENKTYTVVRAAYVAAIDAASVAQAKKEPKE